MLRKTLARTAAALSLAALAAAEPAVAGDIHRKIIAELDPIAPASATYEEQTNDTVTSKWGGQVDFNLAGVVSTGPELWSGNFVVTGPEEPGAKYRREDFLPGERQKVDAMRLRWMISRWEQPASMRGWFVKAGYSYMRINSRANRVNEVVNAGGDPNDATPEGILFNQKADDETDLVTDIRHGVAMGFGNRWLFVDQKLSVNLGCSGTAVFKRTVSVDSKDTNARKDYDMLVEGLPDTRMETRPTPELNIGLGYAW